jgi:hypothetical protein
VKPKTRETWQSVNELLKNTRTRVLVLIEMTRSLETSSTWYILNIAKTSFTFNPATLFPIAVKA